MPRVKFVGLNNFGKNAVSNENALKVNDACGR